MAITRGTKKWWLVHIGAGVVAVALVVFGAEKCSDEKSVREENKKIASQLEQTKISLDDACSKLDTLRGDFAELVVECHEKSDAVRMQRDTIDMQRDSIMALNDSLGVVNGKLDNCRKSAKKPTKPAPAKPVPAKPVPAKPAPAKPVPAKPVVRDTVVVNCPSRENVKSGDKVNVKISDAQNNGAIVVDAPCATTDIKLENGAVNNGAIVVGNGNYVIVNQAAMDTLAKAQKQIKTVQVGAVFYRKSK